MYADAGFEDILYGFPYIAAHQQRAWNLRERLEEFHLMVSLTSFERIYPREGEIVRVTH